MTEAVPNDLPPQADDPSQEFHACAIDACFLMHRIERALIAPATTLPEKRWLDPLRINVQRMHDTLLPLCSDHPRDSA